MKILTKLGGFFDHIITISAWLACGCILFSMLSINADVISRRLLRQPLIWTLEVNEYLLLYIAFLGTAWVLRDKGHTTIDLFLVRLDPANRIRLNVFTSILGAVVCLILGLSSGLSTWSTYKVGWYYETALMAPHWIMHIVVSFGFFLLFIQFARIAHQYLITTSVFQKKKRP